MQLTLSDIVADIEIAEDGLHRFERRYWISSDHFYELYAQGSLDNGENSEDFSEWAGHYKLKQKRLLALEKLSQKRLYQIRGRNGAGMVRLMPAESTLQIR